MDKETYSKLNTAENSERICVRIKEEAEHQIKTILEKANTERERILTEAKTEIEINGKEFFKNLERELEKMKDRVFSTVNIEKKRLSLEERNKFVEAVLENVKAMANNFRNDKGYRNFLEKLILEGVDVIDNDEIDIFYSFLDEKNIKDGFVDAINNLCRAKFNKSILLQFKSGKFKDIGFIMQSKDGRVIYDARFSSLLKRVYEEVYVELLRG